MTALPHRHAAIRRRKVIAWGAGVLASALPVGQPSWAAAPSTTQAHPSSQPTLCALFPESGAEALPGDEAWRGVELALDKANHGRPEPIRLIRIDADDPARSIAKIAATSPPTAFLGTMSSSLSFAATAAAELANIPYIELDAPADAITSRGFKMLHRIGLTTRDLATTTISTITTQLAPSWHRSPNSLRVALLFDEGATDGAYAAALLARARHARLPILLTMGYATDKMDLSAQVARMQRARVDLLIHAGRTDHVVLLYEALAIAAWRPRMIIGCGAGYGMSVIGQALGPQIENTMVIDAPLYGEAAETIRSAYFARYAANPASSLSLTTYVGTTLVVTALDQGQNIAAALTAMKRQRGALANGWGVDFGKSGQNRASFATLQQWRAGRLISVDSTIPGAAKAILSL